jgi:glycosyltransferase involved in cell wall biosynthesis
MFDDDFTIIYFGNDWFAENRTSSHHVARQLAKKHRLIYVECPGLRAPKSSGRDLKKLLVKLCRFVCGTTTIDAGITVFTLPQLPLHRFRFVRFVNHVVSAFALRFLLFRLGIRRRITWFVVPHVAHLAGTLGEDLSVYYCIDDYSALPDIDIASIQRMDDELTCKADLVFVASETLLDSKRAMNPHTSHSPHGVDIEHFTKACMHDGPLPAELAALPKPVVGFHGLIESWIDLELVDYLARSRPQYSFIMIGRIAVSEADVPRHANLHYLGRRTYESLPEYGRGFDCCIIPYRLTRQVEHANPLKLREYLAMGKPIVSVSTPEIDQFADVVEIARSREEFLERLDVVLNSPPIPSDVARRIGRVSKMSWTACVDAVWQQVAERLRDRGAMSPLTMPAERQPVANVNGATEPRSV